MAKRRTAAQKAATRKMIAANRRRSGAKRSRPARRRNPIGVAGLLANPRRRRRSARRRNPIAGRRAYIAARRRRRNPIGGVNLRGFLPVLKDAAIQGAGAVAMDWAFNKINTYIPASMQRVPGSLGVGDAVKALITVALGQVLRGPTKGLSMKAATGALTVQFRDITASLLPAGTLSGSLGYAVPGRLVNMSNRVGPNRSRMGAFTAPGVTPMLSAFTAPGVTPLLSSSMARDGVRFR